METPQGEGSSAEGFLDHVGDAEGGQRNLKRFSSVEKNCQMVTINQSENIYIVPKSFI